MIESGSSFGGYRVERLLGSGGMGVVYEAVQVSLDRKVALKILKPELAADPTFVDRFRREGRLQATVEHPNVLAVYEVGKSDEHGLFLAMRFVDGPTLADLLRAGELDAGRTLRLLEQVGSALDAAHEAGLVHRDIKPQNILIGDGDHAFLADFGLSRIGTDPESRSRPTVGTVAYVAPEVIEGELPTPASDRYAFAATLFHCITGDVVFPRGSEAAVLFAHVSEAPPRISGRRPELPAALDQIFEEALAKDPGRRPGSARGLVASVRERLEAAGMSGLGPPRPGSPAVVSEETLPPGSSAPKASSGRRRFGILVAVALVAAAIGAGAVALLDDDDGGDGEASGEIPVPALSDGAEAIGSTLDVPDRSLGCRGSESTSGADTCSLVQSELGGAQLVAPSDGVITGWSVRGASGEVALDVIRPRGKDTVRVARSQWESAGNTGQFHYEASLPVERGDRIGVELGPGATIGVRDVEDAETQRWLNPLGGTYGLPDRGPGTDLESELLVRADFVAEAKVEQPEVISGAEARRAPDGVVRETIDIEISKPGVEVRVDLVELKDEVVLDLYDGKRRVERIVVPDLVPGGEPIGLEKYVYEGSGRSEADVFWVNPNSGRMFFHFFTVTPEHIKFTL